MSAVSLVDTLIWTTLISACGLVLLVLKDEGFFVRKRTFRKSSSGVVAA